jgi:DNA-binding transcriptional LysR family regulator
MDFQQLRVFRAAAKNGGFTRASEQLHLSQSTVSQHIKQLESDLGGKLFARVGRRVVLSKAGELLLQYADRIFQDLKHAEMAVRELSMLKHSTVRLGVGAATMAYRLPRILSEYSARFPEIELVVVTGPTEILLEHLRAERVDIAIVMSPSPEPGMTIASAGREELVVVLRRGHPAGRKGIITPAELAKLRYISYEKGARMQNLIDQYFESLGIAPRAVMELENIESIKGLVRSGLGFAVLPKCTVTESGQARHFRIVAVKGPPLVRELGLVHLDAAMLPSAIRELGSRIVAGMKSDPSALAMEAPSKTIGPEKRKALESGS